MYFYEMHSCQTLFLTLQIMTVNINYKKVLCFCVYRQMFIEYFSKLGTIVDVSHTLSHCVLQITLLSGSHCYRHYCRHGINTIKDCAIQKVRNRPK